MKAAWKIFNAVMGIVVLIGAFCFLLKFCFSGSVHDFQWFVIYTLISIPKSSGRRLMNLALAFSLSGGMQ